ncbi:MAG: HAMP domain-containing protein [Anaerolineae bacterium]|nr:HAMP domain-containing protein [Anaerolineae bacterium]
MTLRKKTLIFIGLTLTALIIVLYFALRYVLVDGFAQVEDQVAQRNVQRVYEAFTTEVDAMARNTGDYAPWNDTYNFIEDKNQQYIDDNMVDSTFANLQLNAVLFFNTAHEIVYNKEFDLQNGIEVPVDETIPAHFAENDQLLQHSETTSVKSGFILFPKNPMLVGSRPIVTNDFEGPIRGTLVMGRFLNDELISQLENRTQFVLNFHRLDEPQTTATFESIIASITEETPILIEPLSSERLAGYMVLPDVYGQPGLLLQVEMPRTVYTQSQTSLKLLIAALLIVGVVFIILTLLMLEKLVLSRLASLHAGVEEIGSSGDFSKRLSFEGSDEIADLADGINTMLQDLQNSLQREKELKREVQQLRIEIDQTKKKKQVNEIVETDFFQDLQAKARAMRNQAKEKTKKTDPDP